MWLVVEQKSAHEDRVEQTIGVFTSNSHSEIKAQDLVFTIWLSTTRSRINRIQVCAVTTTSAIGNFSPTKVPAAPCHYRLNSTSI
jgi:hypothetical protein